MHYYYVTVGKSKPYSCENARILPNIGWCTDSRRAIIYCVELMVIRYIWVPMLFITLLRGGYAPQYIFNWQHKLCCQ